MSGVDVVYLRESWIIAEEQGRKPRLKKTRYFSFANRRRIWTDGSVDIVVTTREAEQAVRGYICTALCFKPYEPGPDDPSTLIEVFA